MWKTIGLIILITTAGCAKFGPNRVVEDRFNYSNAIGISFKEQVLLNIVKLRYTETPIMLKVGSIVSSYSLGAAASLTGEAQFGDASNVSPGLTGTFTESPTITYSQVTGQEYVQRYLQPIPPAAFVYLINSDWRADHMFLYMIEEANGLWNQSRVFGNPADQQFIRVSELFLILQKAGSLALKVDSMTAATNDLNLTLINPGNDPNIQQAIQEFQTILGLDPTTDTYEIVFGSIEGNNQTIALKTRSTMQMMMEFATYINVPDEHLSGGSAEVYYSTAANSQTPPVIIRSGASKPDKDVFVSVQYRDNWYWIDHNDLETKRTMNILMILFAITESGEDPVQPLLTINTN